MMRLAIVVPCYNEEAVLPEAARRLVLLLEDLCARGEIERDSGIYFVDDGSKDGTWRVISSLAETTPWVHGIKLSRNRGHQNALLAGMFTVPCDALVSIDADLQDDPDAIRGMLAAYRGGAEVVYGVRRRRNVDTTFKRFSARAYYRIMAFLGVEIVYDHADYRLMSRRAIEALKQYRECNLFLRCIVPQLGFDSAIVHYDRSMRLAGESKYPLEKMLAFAFQGLTSFSAAPLRAITALGFGVSILSFSFGLWTLWERMVNQVGIPGWASTLVPMFFLGGIQLLSLGVIGEYVAKTYMESKGRPRYIVDRETFPTWARLGLTSAEGIGAPGTGAPEPRDGTRGALRLVRGIADEAAVS